MIQFDRTDALLTYLESNDSYPIKFNKIRIRKDSGYVSISTDSEELCISLQLNSDQDPLFTTQEIVDLVNSLGRQKISTSC